MMRSGRNDSRRILEAGERGFKIGGDEDSVRNGRNEGSILFDTRDAVRNDVTHKVIHRRLLTSLFDSDGDTCPVTGDDEEVEGMRAKNAIGVDVFDLRILRVDFDNVTVSAEDRAYAMLELTFVIHDDVAKERVTSGGLSLFGRRRSLCKTSIWFMPIGAGGRTLLGIR